MYKYFLDTEFIEGSQKTFFAHSKPTIDLISIGIVCDDGREYYAISKEFNLKEAWNRFDLDHGSGDQRNHPPKKVYWIRDNVLRNLFPQQPNMTFDQFKLLIAYYGKTNKQIAKEVYNFCSNNYHEGNTLTYTERIKYDLYDKFKPEFYAYYGDYDWVVFCWLFGRMIDLPTGFPKYCKDLQQTFDEKKKLVKERMKDQPGYPVNTGIHNALEDARWNLKLYNFLSKL